MKSTPLSAITFEVLIRLLQAVGNNKFIVGYVPTVYGNTTMSDDSTCNWCREFKNGHTDVHKKGAKDRN